MRRLTGALVVAGVLLAGPAAGWWGKGHEALTRAAVVALPAGVPAFLREGAPAAAHVVNDPDLFKNPAVPHLADAEHGEHYFDVELLAGTTPPATRSAFLDTCARLGLTPSRVGLLPYAVVEWTERLAVGLAEHRRWPDDPQIRAKCLVYAGMLAHYAQDACQPLHVTVDYDGRRQADGSMVGRGIHEKADALIERCALSLAELTAGRPPSPLQPLMAGVIDEIDASRGQLDRLYALDARLADPTDPEVRQLALERGRAAVRFTASLYLTAWEISESVRLPAWHQR